MVTSGTVTLALRDQSPWEILVFPLLDNVPRRQLPLATWTIILANGLVFAFELTLPSDAYRYFIYHFGLVPARFTHEAWGSSLMVTAHSLWPFFTSMFLHAGWLHIIFNMWALWIFGDNVEDRLGHVRFLIFYLVCGLIAAVVQTLISISSDVPTIGASGAIAGVLGAYFVLFPRAKVIVVFPILYIPLFFPLPAALFIGFWLLLQFLSGALSLISPASGAEGIAWWAHVGGFAAGIGLHRLFLVRQPARRPVYPDEYGTKAAWYHG
jgi:membrane associated rhomboid family serine protease